jgi:hypothetical protein
MAKTLTIKFKGASNLAYLSLFPEDLFDQIDTIEDADFNVSDLSAFAVSESIIGKGLQWDSLEVSASLDGDQIYLGELLRKDLDSEQILGPCTAFQDVEGQEAEDKIGAAIFSDSHRCKYALVEVVDGSSSVWSVSFDVDHKFEWEDLRVTSYCLDFENGPLGRCLFEYLGMWQLMDLEPWNVIYRGVKHELEHESDEGGGNSLYFFEYEAYGDGKEPEWQDSWLFEDKVNCKLS